MWSCWIPFCPKYYRPIFFTIIIFMYSSRCVSVVTSTVTGPESTTATTTIIIKLMTAKGLN